MKTSVDQDGLRIGLDLGGSKIEGILMGPGATELARYRIPTPRCDYAATIVALVDLTAQLAQGTTGAKVGIAVPGSVSPLSKRPRVPDRFARDLAVQLAGHDMLKNLGIA